MGNPDETFLVYDGRGGARSIRGWNGTGNGVNVSCPGRWFRLRLEPAGNCGFSQREEARIAQGTATRNHRNEFKLECTARRGGANPIQLRSVAR